MKIKARVKSSGSQRCEFSAISRERDGRSEGGGQRPEVALYRVRHVKSGLYLLGVAEHTPAVRWSLEKKELGLVLPRRQAACVADAWIAVTGDTGVEIEPVEA